MNENSVIEELKKLKESIENAKRVPFSRFVSVDRDELLKRISIIENSMPGEMKKAFMIDRKRNEIIENAYKESENIIRKAKEERERMIAESDIVKEAKEERERILKEAREEANSIISEAENYSAQLLAKVESVLDKAKNVVREGRESFLSEDSTSKYNNE
ncbi:MAG: hypothetical protein J7L03_06085 [Caldisericaceae bacterium]|nr:hypothetical protein [Caldisericaceae bacterium]